MHVQRIELADERDAVRVGQRHLARVFGDAQREAGVRGDLGDIDVGIGCSQAQMPFGIEVEQPEFADQPVRPAAAMAEGAPSAAVRGAVPEAGDEVATVDEAEQPAVVLARRAAVRRGPQREVPDVARQVAAAAAARQLEPQTVLAEPRHVGVAVSVDLQPGKEHPVHAAGRGEVEQFLDVERTLGAAIEHPVVRSGREEGRARVQAVGRAGDEGHVRCVRALGQMQGQLHQRRAETVEDEGAVLDRAREVEDHRLAEAAGCGGHARCSV